MADYQQLQYESMSFFGVCEENQWRVLHGWDICEQMGASKPQQWDGEKVRVAAGA